MRISPVNRQNFGAKYQVATQNTSKQIVSYYDAIISRKREEVEAQRAKYEAELQKYNILKAQMLRLNDCKEMTIQAMRYMNSKDIQEQIASLPKHDVVTLVTPDTIVATSPEEIVQKQFAVPYLKYEHNARLFERAPKYFSKGFEACYFEDEKGKYAPQNADAWLSLLNLMFSKK